MNFKAIACFILFVATTNASTAQNSKSQQSLSITMPGKSWSLVVDAPGFAVESQGRKPDGREYLLANNAKNKVVLSITLEESPKGADPKTCPGYLHGRGSR